MIIFKVHIFVSMFYDLIDIDWLIIIHRIKNSSFATFHFMLSLLLRTVSFERCLDFVIITLSCSTLCIICIKFSFIFPFFRNTVHCVSLLNSSDSWKDSTVDWHILFIILEFNKSTDSRFKFAHLTNERKSIEINRSNFKVWNLRLSKENLFDVSCIDNCEINCDVFSKEVSKMSF